MTFGYPRSPMSRGPGPQRRTELRRTGGLSPGAALSRAGGFGAGPRKPMPTRAVRPRRPAGPTPQQARRAEADAIYYDMVRPEVFKRDGFRCQLSTEPWRLGRLVLVTDKGDQVPCGKGPIHGALEVSHTIPRGRWAEGYTVLANCLTVCHEHGQAIHRYPAHAELIGVMGKVADIPRLRAGWVMPRGA